DAVGNDTQCVNVQTRVGLIHDSELWLEQIKLHNLVALLLAAGETFVDGTSDEDLSMCRRSRASVSSLFHSRSLGASPRTAVTAERMNWLIFTPATSVGYCIARKTPARARSSTSRSRMFSPSSNT